MTIIENIKGIMMGNREFGNFAIYIYRSYEKVKVNMTWKPCEGSIPSIPIIGCQIYKLAA